MCDSRQPQDGADSAPVPAQEPPATALLDTPDMVNLFKDQIESLAVDGWDQDERGRFDWEGFADRFERYNPTLDLGSDMSTPAFRRFQTIARAAAREARGD